MIGMPTTRGLGTLGGWGTQVIRSERPHRPPRAGWPGHAAGWPGTPVTGLTPTSGAFVSGCASAAARSPASRSIHGVRSGTSQPTGASRSAGVTGAARLSHASCIAGVRGSMSVRTTASSSASSTSALAAARRSIPVTFLRIRLTCPSLSGMDTGVGGQNRPGASVSAADRARRAARRPGSHEACGCIASSGALAMS
jgi:hypothetical protein